MRPTVGGGADVELAVLLLVHADVVAGRSGAAGAGPSMSVRLEVLGLEHLAELLDAPVGDQELQPGAVRSRR